jgi:hypothetical protein
MSKMSKFVDDVMEPGPKYSTMAPVPPLTVRMSATFKMTSLGEVQPFSLPKVTWFHDQMRKESVSLKMKIEKGKDK